MGFGISKRFNTDVFRVEISGPNQIYLIIINLPGFFRIGNFQQSVKNVKTIRNMVRKIISRPRNIIIAIILTNNEFNNQEITELARKINPQKIRTLGFITKPNKFEKGSESEKNYLNFIRNQNVVFKFGWYIFRNQGYRKINSENGAFFRNKMEKKNFSRNVWRGINLLNLKMAIFR